MEEQLKLWRGTLAQSKAPKDASACMAFLAKESIPSKLRSRALELLATSLIICKTSAQVGNSFEPLKLGDILDDLAFSSPDPGCTGVPGRGYWGPKGVGTC